MAKRKSSACRLEEVHLIQWNRAEGLKPRVQRRVRYRDGDGEWQEAESLADAPEQVREALERIRQLAEVSDGFPLNVETSQVDKAEIDLAAREKPVRRRRTRKPRTSVREIDRTLSLDHPWLNLWTLLVTMVAAPWLAYLGWQQLHEGAGMALVGSGILALATFMAYFGLCILVNATEYHVDENWLTVKHGPLPWFGAKQVPVDRIVQLSTSMHRTRHSLTFNLWASLSDGSMVRLAEGLPTEAEAHSIERAIERHLGIEDWDR